MAGNSLKSQARRHQQATGVPYTQALREVTKKAAGPVSSVPMSADAAKMLSLMGLDNTGRPEVSALWDERTLPVGTDAPIDLSAHLRVPLGLQADAAPVWLDLKGGAPGPNGRRVRGHGPNGLLIGGTGTGATTMLRTVGFGLCAQHSPEQLQLVLFDTWRPDNWAAFTGYPHVAEILDAGSYRERLQRLMADRTRALRAADSITLQYQGDVSIVDDGAVSWAYGGDNWPHDNARQEAFGSEEARGRLENAIAQTTHERAALAQELPADDLGRFQFEPAGSIGRYNQVRSTAAGADLPPVPYTVVLVDAWGRLAAEDRGCVELFNALMSKGPALGIHVVLAGQNIPDTSPRINTRLADYRIALRTWDMATSRQVIGTDDACGLPTIPGVGLFRGRPGAELLAFRGFMLHEDWIRDIGRKFAADT